VIDCKECNRIQVKTLLGEADESERREAHRHTEDCEECREDATRDRWLEAAFDVEERSAGEGLRTARRMLRGTLDERRTWCCSVEGPWGPVYLARTRDGLCRVSFRRSEESFLNEMERHELLPELNPARMDEERRELEAYFAGRLKSFTVPVDLRFTTPFQRRVLDATAAIPFGEVASYGDIARRIGNPRASRAVGGALGRNPVAIVVPCHRVLASGGALGGYTGGLAIKRTLLRIEGVQLQGSLPA
jgi:methylated-DNA-[protein]-cysteine S-methyltransferase